MLGQVVDVHASNLKVTSMKLAELLNGFIRFLNLILKDIGKILSTFVILFCVWIIWRGFTGQINAKDEAERQAAKQAIESVSPAVATIIGVVPTIIGAGMIVQHVMRRREEKAQKPPIDPIQY